MPHVPRTPPQHHLSIPPPPLDRLEVQELKSVPYPARAALEDARAVRDKLRKRLGAVHALRTALGSPPDSSGERAIQKALKALQGMPTVEARRGPGGLPPVPGHC